MANNVFYMLKSTSDKFRFKQECIPVGTYIPPALYRMEGLIGGSLSVSVQGESLSRRYLPDRDPPINRITDRCKNITLPQLRCGW